jgi:hypothetical protein
MRLVDIDDEKFWNILFDEFCVEGSQMERIEEKFDKIKTYDVDKVLEKIEVYKEQAEKMMTKFFDGESSAYEMAIKIIKRGGIE